MFSQEAKSVIVEARRQSRPVPSIVAHEYRDEPRDESALSAGKGLRVPGSAVDHQQSERRASMDEPTKVWNRKLDRCMPV